MVALSDSLFAGLIKLLEVAGGVLYLSLVLMSYRVDGPHCRLRLDMGDPARSAERFLVWVGVRALAASIRFARLVFDTLSEASAEVGAWLINRTTPEVQAAFRSRFLV